MAAAAKLRQPYRQGQEEQLGALGLIVNTIVLYNTIYTQRALDYIADTTSTQPRAEDIERPSPLGTDHTTLTGRYRVLLPAPLHNRSAYRPLNTPEGAGRRLTRFQYETSRDPTTRDDLLGEVRERRCRAFREDALGADDEDQRGPPRRCSGPVRSSTAASLSLDSSPRRNAVTGTRKFS